MRYEQERQSVIDCARQMEAHGLVTLSGGNVSLRTDDGNVLVTPSAMPYDTMVPSDVVLVSPEGDVIEGSRRPTSDLTALLYILRSMPEVNVTIHTHQPWATALSLVCDELPADLVTVIDELGGPVSVAPFTRSSDEGMGHAVVEHHGDARAVILKHHGVIAYGESLDQALSAAVYLEEACMCHLAAIGTGLPPAHLSAEQIADEAEERGYYGQP